MTIPPEIAWGIIIAVVGFILGTLWGHHGAILKRVTYEECSHKRSACPCVKDIEEIKTHIEREEK